MDERERALQVTNTTTDQLALYDRYGSMAYGIILQIIPQPQQAEKVLVELFTASDLQSSVAYPGNIALEIIRMARAKALEARDQSGLSLMQPETSGIPSKTNLPEVVFDMTFRQGYSIDAVAEKLQLAKGDVLKAIRDYYVFLRQA